MKLIILKNNLVEGLNSVENSIGNNTNLPILKNVFLGTENNKIVLISTNLELATKYLLSGKIIETGSVTIPFMIFNNIIKNLNTERINLEKKGKHLVINTDNYEALIHGQDSKDFPIIPSIQNKKNSIKLNATTFRNALSNTIIASQYSDIRPEISGVLISFQDKRLTFVATDSFRLAEIILESDQVQSSFEEVSVIIPLNTASELLKAVGNQENGDIEIFIDSNQILFKTSTQYITSRLIDGNFPDYRAIIPKQTKIEVSVNRREIIDAVKLTKVFAGRASDITVSVGGNKKFLEFHSVDNVLGENSYKVPIKLKGEKFSISFNWRYLLDGLKIYKSEEIILGLNESNRPVSIKSVNEPLSLYIVMPIKT